jgi:hypothetical protein
MTDPSKIHRDDSAGPRAAAPRQPDASIELPAVVLGTKTAQPSVDQGAVAHRRLIPGRAPIHWLSWPMQAMCGLSGALALRAVAEHGEWELLPVLIAWIMLAAWHWMYAMAWEYRRWLLRWTSIIACLLMDAALALACLDRSPEQDVARDGVLITRGAVLEWQIAGGLLVGAAVVLIAHIIWFGRGWREADKG